MTVGMTQEEVVAAVDVFVVVCFVTLRHCECCCDFVVTVALVVVAVLLTCSWGKRTCVGVPAL